MRGTWEYWLGVLRGQGGLTSQVCESGGHGAHAAAHTRTAGSGVGDSSLCRHHSYRCAGQSPRSLHTGCARPCRRR